MRVELDPSFTGELGMLHVWNETNSVIQVTAEGHLLDGKTSAWVTENPVLLELVEIGQAVVLSGFNSPAPTPKKSGKKSKSVEEPSQPAEEEDLPAVQDEVDTQEAVNGSEETEETVLHEENHDN
jgi:hypothetical protein